LEFLVELLGQPASGEGESKRATRPVRAALA
jgi:hypothetical protein